LQELILISADTSKIVNLTKGTQYTATFRNLGNASGQHNDWIQVWMILTEMNFRLQKE
jgi:hypothetical protein